MATKAAEGVGDGQIAVTEDELRELNYNVSVLLSMQVFPSFFLKKRHLDFQKTLIDNVSFFV